MTWISLVCVLALSSSAFGRSAYGSGYGQVSLEQPAQQRQFLSTLPIQQSQSQIGYGQQLNTQPITSNRAFQHENQIQQKNILGSQYGAQAYGSQPRLDQQIQQQVEILTQADILCQGQRAETVIPLENGRKFVVCLDEGKGVEQQCPKGLVYNESSRRCERKMGSLENPCASQPCRYGGQCIATDASSFECQCTPGYDGKTCELDARACQTLQPCGQSQDSKCQSFRAGAALSHMCILQDGLAYGLSAQQAQPSPCRGVDGPQALGVSDKGFIMCDGERMFVESCPGGTIWDDLNKACVWPDMQGVVGTVGFEQERVQQIPQQLQSLAYGQQQRQLINKPTFGHQQQQQIIPRVFNEQPRLVQSYGQQQNIPRVFNEQPRLVQSYGQQQNIPRAFDLTVAQQQPQQQFGQQVQQVQQLKPINFQEDSLQMKHSSGY